MVKGYLRARRLPNKADMSTVQISLDVLYI
jgi:hypothetical protein